MKKIVPFVFVPLACAALFGCTPTFDVRGNLLDKQTIAEVQVGVDTQSDVLRKLGSPTTKAPFDDNIWYYMGQRTEKKGILDPKILEERVIRTTFNAEGVLASIEDVSNKRENIPYISDKTPTSGNEMTVMQQLLGNVGRFNKKDGDGGVSDGAEDGN